MLQVLMLVVLSSISKVRAGPARKGQDGILKIAILGERHSGTNFVEELLDSNFFVHLDSKPGRGRWGYVSQKLPGRRLWSKHCYSFPLWENWDKTPVPSNISASNLGPQEAPSTPVPGFEDVVAVVVVRNPYDWALAMYKYCWCEHSDVRLLHNPQLPFAGFFATPVIDACLRTGAGGVPNRTAGTCAGLLECRGNIYRSHLAMAKWAPNVEYVRHEDLSTDDQVLAWLGKLSAKYRFPRRTKLHNIYKYTSPGNFWNVSKADREKHNVDAAKNSSLFWNPGLLATNEEMRHVVEVVNAHMDMDVERSFNYTVIDLKKYPYKRAKGRPLAA